MMHATVEKAVRSCVEDARVQFEECWTYLCDIKSRKFSESSLDCLTKFQPVLAEAIIALSRKHQDIAGEKKRLIARKNNLCPTWFVRRMKRLSELQKVVLNTLNIGLSLGDAFALFFYRNDPRHLTDHLQQKRTILGPTGVGAIGELEFIRNTPVFHGYFIIFHGITSVLRLGDISLVNLNNFQIAGLGEIKSHSTEPGTVRVELIATGPGLDLKSFGLQDASIPESRGPSISESLDAKQRDRLKRQIKRMTDSFKNLNLEKPTFGHAMVSNFGFVSLEKALHRATSRRMAFERFDDNLIIGVCKSTSRSWWGRVSNQTSLDDHNLLDGLENEVVSLRLNGRSDNAIYVNSICYTEKGIAAHLPGMAHPFWWPIDLELLKLLMFLEAFAFTFYNPAYLIADLESDGYRVIGNEAFNSVAEKNDGKKTLRVERLGHYMTMIQSYLYPRETIIEMFRKIEQSSPDQIRGTPVRMELDIRQLL